jgi:uncharacterized protein
METRPRAQDFRQSPILGDIARDEDGKPSLHLHGEHGLLGLKGGRTVGSMSRRYTCVQRLRLCSRRRPHTCAAGPRRDLGRIALIDLDAG